MSDPPLSEIGLKNEMGSSVLPLILFIPQNGYEQDHFSHYVMRTLVYSCEVIQMRES